MVIHIQERINNLEGLNRSKYSSRSNVIKTCKNPDCKKDFVLKKNESATKYCNICRAHPRYPRNVRPKKEKVINEDFPERRVLLQKKKEKKKELKTTKVFDELGLKQVFKNYNLDNSVSVQKRKTLLKMSREKRFERNFLLLPIYKRYELLERLNKIKDKKEETI